MVGNARSGWPRLARSARMFSSPNLMPNCSRPKRYASGSVNLAWSRLGGRLGGRLQGRRWLRARGAHEAERVGDGRLQLAAIGHEIDHPLLEEEFGALEPLGELLADRLLDDAGPGEADER